MTILTANSNIMINTLFPKIKKIFYHGDCNEVINFVITNLTQG